MFSNWNKWSLIVFIISLLIISPILSIFYSAFSGDTSLWPHLFSTVLPRYTYNTFILMLGVGILSLIFGISTAWIVTRYDFVGKNIFEWALLLPAAVPAYVIAYTYTDLFEYAGGNKKLQQYRKVLKDELGDEFKTVWNDVRFTNALKEILGDYYYANTEEGVSGFPHYKFSTIIG